MTRADEGVYTCFAENDRGKANSTGALQVTGQLQLKDGMNYSSSHNVSGTVGVALMDVSLCWQSSPARLSPSKQP